MQKYQDVGGNSGVLQFEAGDDYINLEFRGGVVYQYDYQKPGREHVENMRRLAETGQNLATYVNQHVRGNYARKLK